MRRRRKANMGIYIIVLAAIISINFAGVNYAMWQDNLQINGQIITGSIGPVFANAANGPGHNMEIGDGEVLSITPVTEKNDETLKVVAKLKTLHAFKINFDVLNKGSIPIRYKSNEEQDGMALDIVGENATAGAIYQSGEFHFIPGEYNDLVQVDENGNQIVEFSIELPYSQWNK